jgi:hypothetical protein
MPFVAAGHRWVSCSASSTCQKRAALLGVCGVADCLPARRLVLRRAVRAWLLAGEVAGHAVGRTTMHLLTPVQGGPLVHARGGGDGVVHWCCCRCRAGCSLHRGLWQGPSPGVGCGLHAFKCKSTVVLFLYISVCLCPAAACLVLLLLLAFSGQQHRMRGTRIYAIRYSTWQWQAPSRSIISFRRR